MAALVGHSVPRFEARAAVLAHMCGPWFLTDGPRSRPAQHCRAACDARQAPQPAPTSGGARPNAGEQVAHFSPHAPWSRHSALCATLCLGAAWHRRRQRGVEWRASCKTARGALASDRGRVAGCLKGAGEQRCRGFRLLTAALLKSAAEFASPWFAALCQGLAAAPGLCWPQVGSNVSWHYAECRPAPEVAEKGVVLMLHGFPDHHRSWRPHPPCADSGVSCS